MYSLSDEKQKRSDRDSGLTVSRREDTGGNFKLKLRTVRTFATTQLPVNISLGPIGHNVGGDSLL